MCKYLQGLGLYVCEQYSQTQEFPLSPRYIVFQNADEDVVGALWWVGYATHIRMWEFFNRKNSDVFYRVLSAGMATFDTKTKKFQTFGHSTTLSKVPHDTDAEVLKTTFTDNTKLQAVLGDFGDYPEFTFMVANTDFVKPDYLAKNKLNGQGPAKFRIHDSERPFKLNFPDVSESVLHPLYLQLMEDRLVV